MSTSSRWARVVVGAIAFVVCLILPIGALGAIDWSYTSSVGVPQPRTRDQHQDWQDRVRARVAGPEEASSAPALPDAATAPVLFGLVLAALVVTAVVARPAGLAPPEPSLRLLPARGPPSHG